MTVEKNVRNDRLWTLVALEDMTLLDAGRQVGLSSERVRQIIFRAASRRGLSLLTEILSLDEKKQIVVAAHRWDKAKKEYFNARAEQLAGVDLRKLTGVDGAAKLTKIRADLNDDNLRAAEQKYILVLEETERNISDRAFSLKNIRAFAKQESKDLP